MISRARGARLPDVGEYTDKGAHAVILLVRREISMLGWMIVRRILNGAIS
jgi:hypothetical protein